jgi:hypothetical protein
MRRSRILSGILALIPAVLLVTSDSSLGLAKADDCRIKPDGSAPPGMHWYYRVDRANNRHCWYLHAQGLPVHSAINASSRDRNFQNDTADEPVLKMPPVIGTPQPVYEQSDAIADRQADFTSRWIDLPKSVDLNAPELPTTSNGYAVEQEPAKRDEQLPPAWPNVSAVNAEAPQNSPAATSFGSISLAGAAVLALLLISEVLLRFVRRSGQTLLHRRRRTETDPYSHDPELAIERSQQSAIWPAALSEPMSRAETGGSELRRLLQRADTGLKPAQSFAPSRSLRQHDHGGRTRPHSALQRPKSRSFSDMTWAPL